MDARTGTPWGKTGERASNSMDSSGPKAMIRRRSTCYRKPRVPARSFVPHMPMWPIGNCSAPGLSVGIIGRLPLVSGP